MSEQNEMRKSVKEFYDCLKTNDTARLQELIDNGFPLDIAQTFSEYSLPEYAMKNGSVECAWILMSKGLMPEKWSNFSGEAWKNFLKKGWDLVIKGESNISPDAYFKITKLALKNSGQKLPDWLENKFSELSVEKLNVAVDAVKNKAFGLFGKFKEKLSEYRDKEDGAHVNTTTVSKTDNVNMENQSNKVKPIFVPAIKVDPKMVNSNEEQFTNKEKSTLNNKKEIINDILKNKEKENDSDSKLNSENIKARRSAKSSKTEDAKTIKSKAVKKVAKKTVKKAIKSY